MHESEVENQGMTFGRPCNRDSACSRNGKFSIILTMSTYNFKSATASLSYDSENVTWVERNQQVFNFKVRA